MYKYSYEQFPLHFEFHKVNAVHSNKKESLAKEKNFKRQDFEQIDWQDQLNIEKYGMTSPLKSKMLVVFPLSL